MANEEYEELYGDLYGDDAGKEASAPAPAPAPAAEAPVPIQVDAAPTSTEQTAPAETSTAPATGSAGFNGTTTSSTSFGAGYNPNQYNSGFNAGDFSSSFNNAASAYNNNSYSASGNSGSGPRFTTIKPSDMPDEGKMFIGGLNWDTTDDTLKDYFSQFGKVTHCTIMRDVETRRSRGFAFLTFEDPAIVDVVLKQDRHILDGKAIDPKIAVPRGAQPIPSNHVNSMDQNKLFIRNIPADATSESFQQLFSSLGAIVNATLMLDKNTGRHRGFGFVTFEDPAVAERVLNEHHQMGDRTLEIKRAAKNRNPRENRGGGGVGGGYNGNNNNNNNNNNQFGGNQFGGNNAAFDPAMFAKYFQQMNWQTWNPLMMGLGGNALGGNAMGGAGGGYNPSNAGGNDSSSYEAPSNSSSFPTLEYDSGYNDRRGDRGGRGRNSGGRRGGGGNYHPYNR